MTERNVFCQKCEQAGPRRFVCVNCARLRIAPTENRHDGLACYVCGRVYNPLDTVNMCLKCANGFLRRREAA